MSNLLNKFEEKLMPLANKISSQKYLKAIRNAFLSLLPITMAGGIASVLGAAPVTEATTNPFMLAWASLADSLGPVLSWVNALTMGAMSFYLAIGMTYYLSRENKIEVFHPLLLTIFGFFILVLIPQELSFAGNFAEITFMGGQGIVPAMLISIVTVELYTFMRKKKIGEIKMPPSVPEALSTTFGVLVPAIFIIFIYALIYFGFYKMGTTPVNALYDMLQPTIDAADNLFFVIFVTIVTTVLFFFGIHDTAVAGLVGPIREGNLALNAAAKAGGQSLKYVFTTPFWVYFVIIGGVGSSLALGLLLIRAKSKTVKYVGRIGIIPSFFGINEPIIFGLPVMLNPLFFIPHVLAPLFNAILAYILMSSGVIEKTFAMVSWNMPNIFGVYLSTLDPKTILFSIFCLIINMLIYYPFYKMYDNQQFALEQNDLEQ